MQTIIVSQLLDSTKAISADSGKKLLENTLAALETNEKITLDFSDVRPYTTMFFNAFVADMIINYISPIDYNERVHLTGLSPLGQATYQKSYNNALNFDGNKAVRMNEIISSIE